MPSEGLSQWCTPLFDWQGKLNGDHAFEANLDFPPNHVTAFMVDSLFGKLTGLVLFGEGPFCLPNKLGCFLLPSSKFNFQRFN